VALLRGRARLGAFTLAVPHTLPLDQSIPEHTHLVYIDSEICLDHTSYPQSAPDRRFGKFRCAPRRIGLAGGDGRRPRIGVFRRSGKI
jgi:hypothetical protein